MSQFLSLSAFAAEVGWQQDDIMKLIEANQIKAHQLPGGEPYIPKAELNKVRQMSYSTAFPNAKEERLIQDEVDRKSRAHSRSKISTERAAEETATEERRQERALKRDKQSENTTDS
jgi:hypothetical protein